MSAADQIKHNAVYRQQKIVEILKLLHNGGSFEKAKAIFDETFDQVDVAEITSAERELIASGLNPMEIQHLCNVHAAVFKGKITDEQTTTPDQEQPGHPVQVLKLENLIIGSLLQDELLPCLKKWQQSGSDDVYLQRMRKALQDLTTIDRHYTRKENLIFPLMDKYGITAPPKVMWGVDDQIRDLIKQANKLVAQEPLPDKYVIETAIEAANKEIKEMIFKEEEIMVPMVNEVFTVADWGLIAAESDPIGYTLIAPPLPWRPTAAQLAAATPQVDSKIANELNEMAQALADQQTPGRLKIDPQVKNYKVKEFKEQLGTPAPSSASTTDTQAATAEPDPAVVRPDVATPAGSSAKEAMADYQPTQLLLNAQGQAQIAFNNGQLDLGELTGIFKVLPVDLTFVDANDQVAWFSDDGDRVFPRTKAVVGRAVINCHPPKSADRVLKILSDFHQGLRDHADFWIDFRGRRVYIRYFAVHDEQGQYAGCLEVTQDITKIQQLTGQKRLEDEPTPTVKDPAGADSEAGGDD
ncbi:DUF438 domain-containing protein [Lapidilactobacillus luobeiensis]|uniref:DUF438 domain-containing protein n=1 Tax=Lapidilactobacillus luobeiensis TaxID=2950371 RepID=UPI0021C368AF|nr:DUF438 domain-containing protein [Lapidilactobacillus luobeiensis]